MCIRCLHYRYFAISSCVPSCVSYYTLTVLCHMYLCVSCFVFVLFCVWCVFFLMIRRPPRSTLDRSSAASDVYKRQAEALAAASAICKAWRGGPEKRHAKAAHLHSRLDRLGRAGLLYTSPSPRDRSSSRMPSYAWPKKTHQNILTPLLTVRKKNMVRAMASVNFD